MIISHFTDHMFFPSIFDQFQKLTVYGCRIPWEGDGRDDDDDERDSVSHQIHVEMF